MKLSLWIAIAALAFDASAQNAAHNEVWNYGTLNLNSTVSPNKWNTYGTSGKFCNYGGAGFTNSGSALQITSATTSWVTGYVKHYATTGNTGHIYPVGSTTERMFVQTTSEVDTKSIATAWIPGAYNTGNKVTITMVSGIGRWDWISTHTTNVNVSVKLPPSLTGGITNKSYLRLVGWNGSNWVIIGTAGSDANGILSGVVPSNITALGIGSTTTITNFKQAASNITGEKPNENYLKLYPNPSDSGIVTVECKILYQGSGKLVITDMLGKKVHTQSVEIADGDNSYSINTSQMPSGIYVVALANNQGKTLQSEKLIVK